MRGKLWYMNADFEMELAAGESPYKRPVSFEAINHRLAPRLLWLADPGDYLLLDRTPDSSIVEFSEQHGVALVVRGDPPPSGLAFSPWGWTLGMQRLAQEYQC